ncbi:formyltransferase family protein [Gammaproteobacteria bacterium]|nr:formyltransferase family protein [Gammaproteobacteria bacterium]
MSKFPRPVRVVILYSAGHLGSALIMNRLVDMSEIEVVGVVKAQPLSLSRQGRSQVKRHLQQVGWRFAWLLFFQRVIQGIGYALSMVLPARVGRLLPAWKIAGERNIPLFETRDINASASIEFLRQCQPDLLVSAYFSQILKTEVLQVARFGVLNIHPGWLPTYRGAMAYFWVLHNGSERGGVSVHWIDEGIDTGEILERRSFPIAEHATQETILMLTAVIGARLLRRVIRRLQGGQPARKASLELDAPAESNYPMPGDKEFASYFKMRRFFRIRDVLGLIAFRGPGR